MQANVLKKPMQAERRKTQAYETQIIATKLLQDNLSGKAFLTKTEISIYKQIIMEASQKSFYFFLRYVLGFSKVTEQTHRRWANDLQERLSEKRRFLFLKPRGTYKTTIYGIGFILWLWAVFSRQLRIFYTSANKLLIDEVSDALVSYLPGRNDEETLYSFVFDIRLDSTVKNTTDVINIQGRQGKGFSLSLKPAGAGTAGVHPNVIIVDDPCDKRDRNSRATRRDKARWLDTLQPLLIESDGTEPAFKHIIVIGTRWHFNDLYSKIIERNGDALPENHYQIEIEKLCNANLESNYPEFISNDKVAVIKNSIDENFFACQQLNDPLPDGIQVFSIKRLQFFNIRKLDFSKGRTYCFIDPSQGKEASDYPAVIWVYDFNNVLYLIKSLDEKMLLSDLVKYVTEVNEQLNTVRVYYESNGSSLLGESLREGHNSIGFSVDIRDIKHTINKYDRIRAMQPQLYSGVFKFRDDYAQVYPETMDQLIYFPAWEYDDYPDVIEMAITELTQGRVGGGSLL